MILNNQNVLMDNQQEILDSLDNLTTKLSRVERHLEVLEEKVVETFKTKQEKLFIEVFIYFIFYFYFIFLFFLYNNVIIANRKRHSKGTYRVFYLSDEKRVQRGGRKLFDQK